MSLSQFPVNAAASAVGRAGRPSGKSPRKGSAGRPAVKTPCEIRTILYATDLGDNASKVFAYAVSIARRYQASICLLHAVEPLGPTARSLVRNVVPNEKLQQIEAEGLAQVREEIHRRLSAFAERELGTRDEGATFVTRVLLEEGYPDQVILDQGDRLDADLIVMGTHGQARLERALLGSVARKVIHRARRPVLLVPIDGDK